MDGKPVQDNQHMANINATNMVPQQVYVESLRQGYTFQPMMQRPLSTSSNPNTNQNLNQNTFPGPGTNPNSNPNVNSNLNINVGQFPYINHQIYQHQQHPQQLVMSPHPHIPMITASSIQYAPYPHAISPTGIIMNPMHQNHLLHQQQQQHHHHHQQQQQQQPAATAAATAATATSSSTVPPTTDSPTASSTPNPTSTASNAASIYLKQLHSGSSSFKSSS
ncbi:hypothetical protein CAS74_003057 [Pichia kudriavzevii]|uniref:Uncharacterized protein n=1 Tax=Pichia kudriavzevii TaxID=4909 RepID=A0A1Z8JND4_PICKU|nr:hypothetical protein CAS74_003057 [Pichia kudriavzevii]